MRRARRRLSQGSTRARPRRGLHAFLTRHGDRIIAFVAAHIQAADVSDSAAEISIHHLVDHLQAGLMNRQNFGRQRRNRAAMCTEIELVKPWAESSETRLGILKSGTIDNRIIA